MKLFDLHCDTVSECMKQKKSILTNELNLDISRGMYLREWIQTFAFFIHDEYMPSEAWDNFKKQYDFFISERELSNGKLTVYKPHESDCKKCRAVLSVENGSLLENDISRVDELKRMGIDFLTLCWNGGNQIAGGVDSEKGLTSFGKMVVAEMEICGITIDVSHLNEQSFYDVAELTEKPFAATHSNAYSICNHPRNLKDEQIKIIKENKGLIGLNFYPKFVSGGKEYKFEDLNAHIEYFLNLGAENILAIGSDFDGADMPDYLNGIEKLENLYEDMVQCYGRIQTDKIFFDNAAEFLRNKYMLRREK